MITVTDLPLFVTRLFRGMPGIWTGRHRRILGWLVCMPALCPGQKTLEALARWTPASLTVWRLRRRLQASAWRIPLLVAWWAEEALHTLPPPKDGTRHLVGDGSENPKRGTQNPLAQKGRKSEHHPWLFGMRFALVIATWDVERLPGALRLMRPQSPPEYRPDNARFRERVGSVVPPTWAKRMSVEGAAASGSQETRPRVRKREADEPARRWGFGCARARTWKTVEDKAIKDWVTPGPRISSQRIRVPRLPGTQGCKPFWVSSTRLGLRHVGDVTVVLRKKGRNVGPTPPQILGTNLDEWTPSQVGGA